MLAALGLAFWNRMFGLASISPVIAAQEAFWMDYVWRPAIPLIVLFGFAATHRLLAHQVEQSDAQQTDKGLHWRPEGRIYVSKSWWVMTVAVIGAIWGGLTEVPDSISFVNWSTSYRMAASQLLAIPVQYLSLAIVAACMQLTFARLRGRPLAGQVPLELHLNRFAYTWIAVALTTDVSLETAIGMSFVYWMIPWEPLPLS